MKNKYPLLRRKLDGQEFEKMRELYRAAMYHFDGFAY